MKSLDVLWIFLLFLACEPHNAKEGKETKFPSSSLNNNVKPKEDSSQNTFSDTTITYEIIDASEGTYGYDILKDGKVMIHQPTIPGMPGLKGFSKKEDAVKVVELVISKLKNNQMPPTITEVELKYLGIAN